MRYALVAALAAATLSQAAHAAQPTAYPTIGSVAANLLPYENHQMLIHSTAPTPTPARAGYRNMACIATLPDRTAPLKLGTYLCFATPADDSAEHHVWLVRTTTLFGSRYHFSVLDLVVDICPAAWSATRCIAASPPFTSG